MAESDWTVLVILMMVYVGAWAATLVHRYRYIRDCSVPLWSTPWTECFRCPHADRCGRVSRAYRHWGCTPEELDEMERILEERRTEIEHSNSALEEGPPKV